MNDMIFSKYHALGNDYIVINPEDISEECLNADQVKRICHRNFGVGSDGLLLGPFTLFGELSEQMEFEHEKTEIFLDAFVQNHYRREK